MKKLMVAVPIYGQIHPLAEGSISAMLINDRVNICRKNMIDTVIDEARNIAVNTAKDINADWILFLDSDMIFPRSTINKLVDMMDSDYNVISGVCCGKYSGKIMAFNYNEQDDMFTNIHTITHPDFKLDNGIYEVDAVGAACLMIRMSLFDKIPYPYFYIEYENRDDKWVRWGEDLMFFRNLQKYGEKVALHTDIICGHITNMMMVPVDGKSSQIERIGVIQ